MTDDKPIYLIDKRETELEPVTGRTIKEKRLEVRGASMEEVKKVFKENWT